MLNSHALLLTYELQARRLELEIQNQELRAQRERLESQNQELRAQQTRLEIQNEQLYTSQRELVRARDALADLYEHAPVGYVTATREGVVLSANLRFAALLDADRDTLLGCPFSDWIASDDRDVYHHHCRELGEGSGRRVCELRMHRASGETFWVALDSALDDLAEGGAQVRSAVSDITQRKRAEQEQRQLKERLEQSQKMEAIGTLAGGIAHDVNNILAVILALGCRLERNLSKTQGACQDLRDIVAAVYRGKKLIQDLLDFARRAPRRREACCPNDVVERLAAVLERTAPKRIGIELALEEELACVECDPDQLTQILMNICLNSIDAIAGQGTITMATRNHLPVDTELFALAVPAAASYVRIDVTDTGSGMDEETQRRAFEPFFTTKDVGEGTGLGLAMVYGAVHELEGDVRIISRLGCGTTVTLLLPTCPSALPRRRSIPCRGPITLPGYTILLVDDEPMVRSAFGRVLEELGCEVIVADGGRSALELYRANAEKIHAVLLDLSMPVMDGAECYAGLQAIDPDVRVVICTGRARTEATQRLVAQGVPHLLTKPCSAEELAVALAEAVQAGAPVTALD